MKQAHSIAIALLVMIGFLTVQIRAEEPKVETSKDVVKAEVKKEEAKTKDTIEFTNETQKISYMFGSQIGQTIKTQKMEINLDYFLRGMKDMLDGKEPALTQEQQNEIKQSFRKKQMEKMQKESEENLAKSKAFLEANKSKEGVKVLLSGLQYKVITEGTGATPAASDRVKTHYRGTLITGEEFDSSYKRNQPAEFSVRGVIKGWTEALQLMKEGAKWELYIPADLAYGPQGRPNIPPNSALIFEIELLEVVKKDVNPGNNTIKVEPGSK